MAGIPEEEANNIINMKYSKSNSHSAWLTFIYPRLWVSRNLLCDDGVIFISINDIELANLKLLCDEVFGEENFIANITVQVNKGGRDYVELAQTHEYLLCYTKSSDAKINQLDKEGIAKRKMQDQKGSYELRELRNRNPKFGKHNRPNLYYPIYTNPNIIDEYNCNPISLDKTEEYYLEVYPLNSKGEDSCWRWGKPLLKSNIEKQEVVARIKKDENYNIYEKYRGTTTKAKTIWEFVEQNTLWDESEVRTENGTKMLGTLGLENMFDHPKPVELIEKTLLIGSNKNDIILDFFSGSSTTAHAVLKRNAKDGGQRKYIMVNLPEDLDEKLKSAKSTNKKNLEDTISFLDSIGKPHFLTEVGKERIRRAACKVKEETNADIDYGFKVFNCSDIKSLQVNKLERFNPNGMLGDDTILNDFPKEAIIYTWGLEDGAKLTDNISEINIDGYTCYYLNNETIYFLESDLNEKVIKTIIEKLDNDKGFNFNKVVMFGYSFTTGEIMNIKNNIKQLKNGKKAIDVEVEVRY